MTGCRPEFQTRAPGCARRGSCGNRRKHKVAEDRKRRNRIRVTEDRVAECRDSEQPESESQRKDSGKKLLQHQTKSAVAATAFRSGVAAVRTTNDARNAAPGAATQHAKRPGAGARRVLIRCSCIVSRIVPVTTPLDRISVHIIQPESILGVAGDYCRKNHAVIELERRRWKNTVRKPLHHTGVANVGVSVQTLRTVSSRIACRGSRTQCILKLSLCRQRILNRFIFFTGLVRQPSSKRDCIVP